MFAVHKFLQNIGTLYIQGGNKMCTQNQYEVYLREFTQKNKTKMSNQLNLLNIKKQRPLR